MSEKGNKSLHIGEEQWASRCISCKSVRFIKQRSFCSNHRSLFYDKEIYNPRKCWCDYWRYAY